MRKLGIRWFVLLAVLSVISWGCATKYHVSVNSQLDKGKLHKFNHGNLFYIPPPRNDERDPLLYREVAEKLTILLEQRGYKRTYKEDANFILLFNFGMTSGSYETTSTRYAPGGTAQTRSYNWQTGETTTGTVDMPGHVQYVPQTVHYNARSILLTALDPENLETETSPVIWEGFAFSAGSSSDLRMVMNYLLVPLVEKFPEDTGKHVDFVLGKKNKNVQQLITEYDSR